eukprot:Gb_31128 [translate_table: standard]
MINIPLIGRTWLWNIARGISGDEVKGRLLPKSQGCGKTFPGPRALRNIASVKHWLGELSAELNERIQADFDQNKRIAQHLTLHARAYQVDGMFRTTVLMIVGVNFNSTIYRKEVHKRHSYQVHRMFHQVDMSPCCEIVQDIEITMEMHNVLQGGMVALTQHRLAQMMIRKVSSSLLSSKVIVCWNYLLTSPHFLCLLQSITLRVPCAERSCYRPIDTLPIPMPFYQALIPNADSSQSFTADVILSWPHSTESVWGCFEVTKLGKALRESGTHDSEKKREEDAAYPGVMPLFYMWIWHCSSIRHPWRTPIKLKDYCHRRCCRRFHPAKEEWKGDISHANVMELEILKKLANMEERMKRIEEQQQRMKKPIFTYEQSRKRAESELPIDSSFRCSRRR